MKLIENFIHFQVKDKNEWKNTKEIIYIILVPL